MTIKKQTGMNSLLLLFVLGMAGFLLLCFFRLGPAYLDNQGVKGALKTLARDHAEELPEMSKSAIARELSKFYTINNVRGEPTQHLEIERFKEKTIITVAYEVRVPILANVDAVMTFNNVLDSSQPEECCSASDEEE